MFTLVENKIFKKTPIDTVDMMQKISGLADYISVKQIIEKQEADPSAKFIYKLQPLVTPQEHSELLTPKEKEERSTYSSRSRSQSKLEIESKFFKIKVKRQMYVGKPAIAIFMSDYTKKIRDKLFRL